ncbi:MAG: Perillic acid-CoA ligase GeoC [Tardiphaga sp.]|jgi:acyl-CoA synthetase (AMP-forming)/AMP-acid ligase II|nr:Perillic acid-CoA ligase GeoC [Tardiphaga sp.]
MWRSAEIRYLPDIPRYWSEKRPGKVALIEGSAQRTYAQLDERSSAIANRLREMGAKRGDPIGYIGKNSIEVFEVWFAASKIGCTFAPFNWRLAVPELAAILDDAGPPIVFAGADIAATMRQVRERTAAKFEIVEFQPSTVPDGGLASWVKGSPTTDPAVAISGDDIALLSYTSGTTGLPKGVAARHEAFQYSFLCGTLEPALARYDDDILVMSMPNFHLGGSWVSLAALYHGATISILPAFDPDALIATLRRDRPTVVPLVPTAIQLLVSRPDVTSEDFSSVRSIIYFGSPIGQQLLKSAIDKLQCEFCQSYGTTESYFNTIFRHEDHLTADATRLASCGRPLPMVYMKIVDGKGEEVPPGTVGELLVYTPMMMSGYRNRPEATSEALKDGWYRTGDLAKKDSDGFFYIVDRVKDMIVSGGENVYSAEVELALLKHPGVVMAAVIGVPDPDWGEKVTAVVVPRPGTEISEEELRKHCREYLAGYKVPKTVLFETSLPLTPSGKVQKGPLRERFRNA